VPISRTGLPTELVLDRVEAVGCKGEPVDVAVGLVTRAVGRPIEDVFPDDGIEPYECVDVGVEELLLNAIGVGEIGVLACFEAIGAEQLAWVAVNTSRAGGNIAPDTETEAGRGRREPVEIPRSPDVNLSNRTGLSAQKIVGENFRLCRSHVQSFGAGVGDL